MEWCLDCHRNPERYVRPRERGLQRRLLSRPPNQLELGARLVAEYQIQKLTSCSTCHQTDAARRPRRSGGRSTNWPDDPAFQERLHNEFPSAVEAITDPVERRTFLKLMGASLALAGVTACTRQPAETIVPYVRQPEEIDPGQAAVLRDGDDARRRRDRPARREPRRTADEDRRQPASSGQPRRDRRLRAGRDPRPLRSRPRADADQPRRDPPVVGVPRRDPRGARRRSSRSRAPASASSPNRSARRRWPRRFASCSRASRGEVAPVGSGRAARTRAPARGSRSASTSTRSTASIRPTSSCRSTPTSSACGPGSLRYARDFAARRRPGARRAHEPPLRGRDDADADRRARRSPAAAEAERDRAGRPPSQRRRRRGMASPAVGGDAGGRAASGSPPSPRDLAGASRSQPRRSPARRSRRSSTRSRTR